MGKVIDYYGIVLTYYIHVLKHTRNFTGMCWKPNMLRCANKHCVCKLLFLLYSDREPAFRELTAVYQTNYERLKPQDYKICSFVQNCNFPSCPAVTKETVAVFIMTEVADILTHNQVMPLCHDASLML
jgi:hypothetical protein